MAGKAEIILFGSYDFCPHGMGRSPNFCNFCNFCGTLKIKIIRIIGTAVG